MVALPRPIADSYWVLPGRLLAGAHPGSFSRADAMDRLRGFLLGGVTCFIDLTEPAEMPSYEALLPFSTPGGRRVEYFRESIRDHGLPESPEAMERTLDLLDDALESGHTVYVHCRAGIGRSATVIGCWLARRRQSAEAGLAELQEVWQQSEVSRRWPSVPETAEQVDYVLAWPVQKGRRRRATGTPGLGYADRAAGALLGLAVADAWNAVPAGTWAQATSLALCLAESLLERGSFDARDQIERYVRWQRDGHLSAGGQALGVTPDIAKVLATYRWRGLPMAGSHDPRDHSGSSLSRCVAAVLFEPRDAQRAVALAAECSRTTCQSPVVLDACRYYAAMLWGALAGEGIEKLASAAYAPAPGLWTTHPLRSELGALVNPATPPAASAKPARQDDALSTIAAVRATLAAGGNYEDVVELASASGKHPLHGAVAGAVAGAVFGVAGMPRDRLAALARRDLLEQFVRRFVERLEPTRNGA
jgi:ADP-ribosylglycohydrolase